MGKYGDYTDRTTLDDSDIIPLQNGSTDETEDTTVGVLKEHIVGSTWQTWSPTFTGLTIGNGTITAEYHQVGNIVYFRLYVVLGNTSSVTSDPTFTLPVNSIVYPTNQVWGVGRMNDVSAGHNVASPCVYISATTARLQCYYAADNYLRHSAINSNVPFTWATSDSIDVQAFYQAA